MSSGGSGSMTGRRKVVRRKVLRCVMDASLLLSQTGAIVAMGTDNGVCLYTEGRGYKQDSAFIVFPYLVVLVCQ